MVVERLVVKEGVRGGDNDVGDYCVEGVLGWDT